MMNKNQMETRNKTTKTKEEQKQNKQNKLINKIRFKIPLCLHLARGNGRSIFERRSEYKQLKGLEIKRDKRGTNEIK